MNVIGTLDEGGRMRFFLILITLLLTQCTGATEAPTSTAEQKPTVTTSRAGEPIEEESSLDESSSEPTAEPLAPEVAAAATATAEVIAAGRFTVGVMQFMTHPVLDESRNSTLQALAGAGFIEGENLTVIRENAEGDIAKLIPIAQSFVAQDVDLIIASGTPAAQAAYKATQALRTPYVVYNAVADPFAAGLATAPTDHPAWIVGTHPLPPAEEILETMLEMIPDIERVGVIWNPADFNSEVALDIAREEAADAVVELVEATISDSGEMQMAAESLIAQGIDGFLIFTGLTVATDFEIVARIAEENQIPLFADDPFLAERGAAVAIGVNYYYDGELSGEMAAQILAGLATPADFTIKPSRAMLLFVNLDAGGRQLIEFPVCLVENTDEVIGGE